MPESFLIERARYELRFSVDGAGLPPDAMVLVNDVECSRVDRRTESLIPFEIDFYAGELRIALLLAGRIVASYMMDVSPDLLKLTRTDYAAMLQDIARSTKALYRFGQTSMPATAFFAGESLDLVSLELLRAHFDAIERSVSRIADQPVRSLRSRRAVVSVTNAKRIAESEISAALRMGAWRMASARETRAAPRLVRALGGRWIPNVGEMRKADDPNLYENRAVLGFICWLNQRIRAISYKMTGTDFGEQQPIAATWLGRLQDWSARLGRLQRRDLFSGLTPDQSLQTTSVFRANPDYAAAFREMMRIRSGLGESNGPHRLPLSRTYELYEIWCYIGILNAIAQGYPHSRDSIRALLAGTRSREGLGVSLAQSDASRIDLTQRLRVYYQRRFGITPAVDGARTLTVDAIPDVCLVSVSEGGDCKTVVVLDPKYRVGSSLLDGIRDLHFYRDAIVDRHHNRIVVGAAALAPRASGATHIPSLPTNAPVVVQVRPGAGDQVFRDLLALAVQSVG